MRGNTLFGQKNVDKTQSSGTAEITFYPFTGMTGVVVRVSVLSGKLMH